MDQFDRLYARYARPLVGYARILCDGDEQTAQDLVQETFLARLSRSGKRGVVDEASYLFRALRNRWLNRLRADARRERRQAAAASGRPSVFASDPAAPIEAEELERALAALPPEQREVVFLRIWGGLTFSQIGGALGVPLKTAASRYTYALSKLRDMLERAG